MTAISSGNKTVGDFYFLLRPPKFHRILLSFGARENKDARKLRKKEMLIREQRTLSGGNDTPWERGRGPGRNLQGDTFWLHPRKISNSPATT